MFRKIIGGCMCRVIAYNCLVYIISVFFCLPATVSWAQQEQAKVFREDKGSEESWQGTEKPSRFELGGKLRNKLGHDTEEDNEFEDDFYNHAEVQLEAKYLPNETFHAVISLDADYFAYHNDSDWDYDNDIRLHNAYINLAWPSCNLKVGNQIVRWGKSDGYSPLDNLNPEDLRDGIGGRREDRKLAIPMVNLELHRGLYTLQGIFLPFFKKSKFDLLGSDWSLFDHMEEQIGPLAIKEEDPSNTLQNSEAGVRLSGTVRNFDYAFSYFYTHEDEPSLDSLAVPPGFPASFESVTIRDLAVFAKATNQEILLRHDRRNIYGFEFETTLGDFGLRGDAAYTSRGGFITSELKRIRKPIFQYMVGADYNGPEAFYLNLQFSQTFIQGYDDRIVFADDITSAINGTVSKEFLNGDIKLEFRYFYDLSGEAALCNPKFFFNYWQNFSIEVGAEFFDGSDETTIGLFRDNDQVYGIVEVNF